MRNLKDLIPAAILLVFVVSLAGVVLEVTVAAVRGQPVDAVATGGLLGLMTTCAPILAGFYIRDSRPPSPPPQVRQPQGRVEETGDVESDEWNREHGWLELRRWTPRWARS